jgi:C4-dicarboxylate-binding protein DctP
MTITLKFGGYQGANSVHTRSGHVLAEAISRNTSGAAELVFEENISDRGHKAADLLTMTEAGELDGCYFSSSYIARRVPGLGLFDQHFMVPDRRRAYAVLDGGFGARLKAEVANATGYSVLGYWDNGLRHISSTRPIRQPSDCVGLKLRTLPNADHQRVFRALGFDPQAIDVRDLVEAVRTGQVDAQENPLTNTYNFGLHKTHRYITLTNHLLGVALVLFNAERVSKWTPDLRAAIEAAVAEATVEQRKLAEAEDDICTRALLADGVEIIKLDADNRAAFASATRAEVDKIRAGFDPELTALFDADLMNA